MLPSIVLGGGIWLIAPFVGYEALLVIAAIGGVFGLPAFSVIRLALSVAVPPEERRAALALDSISVELAFMTGPALAVLAATTWSTHGVLLSSSAPPRWWPAPCSGCSTRRCDSPRAHRVEPRRP